LFETFCQTESLTMKFGAGKSKEKLYRLEKEDQVSACL
jgi:hypothetical protein